MSYGLFTVMRTDLQDPAMLRDKILMATGDEAAADGLAAEALAAGQADPSVASWHIVPDPDGSRGWRLKRVARS
jgi:hypothetical protein